MIERGDKLLVATRNRGKTNEFREAFAALGVAVIDLNEFAGDLPQIVEDGDTFAANALIKARIVADAAGLPVLADDSGLCVDALGGAPGVYSARYAGEGASDADNNAKLLRELRRLGVINAETSVVAAEATGVPGTGGPGAGSTMLGVTGVGEPGAGSTMLGVTGVGEPGVGSTILGVTGVGEPGTGSTMLGVTGMGEPGAGSTMLGVTGVGKPGAGSTILGVTGMGEPGAGSSMPGVTGAAVPEALSAASFVSALVLYTPGGEMKTSEGTVEGFIIGEAQGDGGFGYDPLFWLPTFGKTMAQLSIAEKNAISHRGKALKKLLEQLM